MCCDISELNIATALLHLEIAVATRSVQFIPFVYIRTFWSTYAFYYQQSMSTTMYRGA